MSDFAAPFIPVIDAVDTWIFTSALVVALPSFAYFFLFKGWQRAGYFGSLSKSQTYLWIAALLWLMLIALFFVAGRHHLSLTDLGQHVQQPLQLVIMTSSILLILALLSLNNFRTYSRMPSHELKQQLDKLKNFFPTGRLEIMTFIIMAISAGICEELLYRGWLLNLLGALTGSVWVGLLLSSVAFGLGHAYQGPKGIVSTGVVGLMMGLLFLWARSLVPVQIVHAFINLSSGLLCAYLFIKQQKNQSLVSAAQ